MAPNHVDKMSLMHTTMNRKEFFSLFPWRSVVKFYVLLLIYTIVVGIVFFSTEQCLNDAAEDAEHVIATQPDSKNSPKKVRNCTTVPYELHFGTGIHEHSNDNDNSTSTERKQEQIVNIERCNDQEENKDAGDKSCQLKPTRVMKWMYFTVVHFHGADTVSLRLTSTWGQSISGPVIIIGIVMATRLYTLIGFIGVNFVNYLLRKLRARMRRHRKRSLRYEILIVAFVVKALYIVTCAFVSRAYAQKEGGGSGGWSFQNMTFKWLMLLTTISDESLVSNNNGDLAIVGGSTEVLLDTTIPIVMIFIGYIFTSTFVAAVVNCRYRLTYKVNAKPHPKKAGLKGWWM